MISDLYISDLDGTLLDNRPGLSDFCRDNLVKLLEKGFPFTFATARSLYSAREILGHLPLRLPIIELNGAFISDFHTGEHLDEQFLDRDAASTVIEIGRDYGLLPNVAAYDTITHHMFVPPPVNPAYEFYLNGRREAGDERLREVEDPTDALEMEVISCAFISEVDKVAGLKERIEEALPGRCRCQIFEEWYFRPWHWLTVQNPDATKGHAIKKLSGIVNIPLNRITAFGDQLNDVPMLSSVGNPVAVENAVAELKEYASTVIRANTEDSVVKYLMQQLF